MINPHEITRQFESEIARYTGAPFCICVDNCSNALFLALTYDNVKDKTITIPNHCYMSVPCEIIHAGGKVNFYKVEGNTITGYYLLLGSNVYDSALSFTADMYIPNSYMCCSFTGPFKHLKLGKGGCILTDNEEPSSMGVYDEFNVSLMYDEKELPELQVEFPNLLNFIALEFDNDKECR